MLADAWLGAVRQLGGDVARTADAAADLRQRYGQPHRRYHTTAHVEAVLRDGGWLADEVGLDADERALLTIAGCAHDVVYDGQPGADERASAAWAASALVAAGVDPQHVRTVERLVLLTVAHATDPSDTVGACLLDADLAVLGGDPDDYARYTAAVREEYAAVPEPAWRAGRAAVLRGLLEHEPLYLTEPARGRWEGPARRNIAAELERLAAAS